MKDNSLKKKTVYAYLHTHWDREWYREFEEFKIRLVEVVDDVLNKLESQEIDVFYFDGQTSALEDYLLVKPFNELKIRNFIEQNKLFIGPYYCSTDSFLVDAESLIKNLQLGLIYSKMYGNKKFLAYHSDTFGHSAHLPNIIKSFNLEHAIFWRGLGERKSEFLFNNLKSIYLVEGYFHDYFSTSLPIEKKVEMLKRTLDRIAKFSSDAILLPIGADHETVPANIKQQIKLANELLDDYEIVLTSPFEYINKVENNFDEKYNGEFRDCTRNFILPGVLSSRIDLKQKNARCQWDLSRKLQVFQALISSLKKIKGFQNEIDALYKLLLKNHAHDSIYGCSLDSVHRENILRYDKTLQGINAITNTIKRDLFVDNNFSVLNLGDYNYNGSVKFVTDKKLSKKYNAQLLSKTKGFPLLNVYKLNTAPITEDYTTLYEYLIDVQNVKPFSCEKLENCLAINSNDLQIDDNFLENNYLRFEVCKNSFNLIDKIKNKKYMNFFEIIDRKDCGDSYNFGPVIDDKKVVAEFLGSKIKSKGHIRSTLQLNFKIRNQKLKVEISLENQNNFLEFQCDFNNRTKNHLLQVEFSLPEEITRTVSDDLCGYIEREFDCNYDIYKHIPAPRGVELKHNTAPMQKCLNIFGFGLITEGLQEYEVLKNKLRLTLLRSTGVISNPRNSSRGTPAGPPLPTPDLQMIGKQKSRFAISLDETIGSMSNNVQKFYGLVELLQTDMYFEQLFSTNNENIVLSTAKLNKNNELILRFLNKSDLQQKLSFSANLQCDKIYLLNMEENIIREYSDLVVDANMFVNLLITTK